MFVLVLHLLYFLSFVHSSKSHIDKRLGERLGTHCLCVTGQLGRLELSSKAKHIFAAAARRDEQVDVVFVLGAAGRHGGKTFFTNAQGVNTGSQKWYQNIQDISNLLDEASSKSNSTKINVLLDWYQQPTSSVVVDKYVTGLVKDKGLGKGSSRAAERKAGEERARGHVRQWSSLKRCYSNILWLERHFHGSYEGLARLREDGFLLDDCPG